MQAISGVHFNYSFPEIIWQLNHKDGSENNTQSFRNTFYFQTIRNISRISWLILYLFGASQSLINHSLERSQMVVNVLKIIFIFLMLHH